MDPGSLDRGQLADHYREGVEAFDRGLRVLHYDFGTPTFRERPEMILGFLRNQLERREWEPVEGAGRAEGTGHGGPTLDRGAELGERRVEQAREALTDRPEARERLDELLQRAHRAYPVREDNEYFGLSILGLIRYAAQEIGRRMVAAGHLERVADVHFLRNEEVEGWLDEPTDLRDVARRRRGERRWALANPGPPEYGEDPAPPPDPSVLPQAGGRVLRPLLWMVENDLDTEPPKDDGLVGVGAWRPG